MTGLYIFGALIVAGLVAIMVFRSKSAKAEQALSQARTKRHEEERLEQANKADARQKEAAASVAAKEN